jgi:putative ABC transport system permease protein
MACTVAQQTREIGLRVALGAERGQIMRHVLREGLTLAVAGLILGLVGAYALGRVMQSTLYGVSPFSVPVWTAVAATLLVAAFVACYVPARRASAVDPLSLLRSQ